LQINIVYARRPFKKPIFTIKDKNTKVYDV